MKRKLFNLILTVIALTGLQQIASATIHTVQVSDFQFSPSSIQMQVGDTIKWVWVNGFHTTTSTTIPTGAAAWDDTLASANDSFMYVPTVAGTYDYHCTPHASMGMTASFVVTPITGISNIENESAIKLSPNPAHDVVNISTKEKISGIDLLDLSGKIVRSLEVFATTGEQTLSIANIPTGMYILRIKISDKIVSRKLMIE